MNGKPGAPAAVLTAAALTLAAAALAGCGVPLDSGPHPLAAGDLPLGLSAPSTTTTQAGPRTPRTLAVVQVYFVAGDRVVARSRLIASPATVAGALGSLLAGPTPAEAAAGVRSAVSEGTQVLGVHESRSLATVDLSSDFAQTGGPDQILAIAQVTYTVTSLPGIGSVSFELAGQPVAVPAANGTLVGVPVTAEDFASLLSPTEPAVKTG